MSALLYFLPTGAVVQLVYVQYRNLVSCQRDTDFLNSKHSSPLLRLCCVEEEQGDPLLTLKSACLLFSCESNFSRLKANMILGYFDMLT